MTDLQQQSTVLAETGIAAESKPNPFGQGMMFNQVASQSPVLSYLKQVEQMGKIQSVDYHFASFIYSELTEHTEPSAVNIITLLAAYVSNQVLSQHTCIQVQTFNPFIAFGLTAPADILVPEAQQWLAVLEQSSVCQSFTNNSEIGTPFVLFGDLLYMNRYFQYEWFIASFINKQGSYQVWYQGLVQEQIQLICAKYFAVLPEGEVDWQKQAVLNAIQRKFAVITGGPGTGKTTTVVKLLASMQELKLSIGDEPLNIQLVAPTGKAAQRLSESIAASVTSLQLEESLKRSIPTQASTVHRLLKPRGLTEFTYNQDNRLGLDVLILDEASMVDISMMYKLFSALPEHAQVILLGDKQQLASVEAGNVLAELAQAQNNDFMVELKKSYRFDDASAIGQLATAIKVGDSNRAIAQLKQSSGPLHWYKAEQNQLPQLIEHAVEHHVRLQNMIAQSDLRDGNNVAALFQHLSQFQLLVCVRQGDFGVEGLNQQIQSRVAKRLYQAVTNQHYQGRPIMISENAYHLDLYNGDIGIELVNPHNGQLMAYFIQGDGEVKQIHCQRLPSHETVYTMTVHKSQGSEFAHVALVLPDHTSSLMSREIIYTGLTRAKSEFSLYAGEYNLRQGLTSSAERLSGLRKMLSA